MLVETMIRQGRFRAATRAGEARSDFEVRWEVLDFEVQEQSMQARFVAEVRLVRQGRQIIASRIISTEAPVASRRLNHRRRSLTASARQHRRPEAGVLFRKITLQRLETLGLGHRQTGRGHPGGIQHRRVLLGQHVKKTVCHRLSELRQPLQGCRGKLLN